MKTNLKDDMDMDGRAGSSRISWVLCFSVSCLLIIFGLAFYRLLPDVAGTGKHGGLRAGWYLTSGQMVADLRTFSSVCRYVFEMKDPLPPTLPRTSPPSQIAQLPVSNIFAYTNFGTNVPTA